MSRDGHPVDRRDPDRVRAEREVDLHRQDRRERGYRTAFRVGLAVSVVLHVFLIGFLSRELYIATPMDEAASLPTPRPPEGVRIVQVRVPEETEPVPTPEQPIPVQPVPVQPVPREEPQEEEEEEARGEPVPAERPEEEGGEEPEAAASNTERLAPRQGDPRLWRDFWDEDLEERYLGHTRADSAIRAVLGTYLDSLRLTEEELRRARDWTVGEGDDRWGISPEGIHLGDITIPLPVGQLFSPTGPRRRELERELRELEAIQRQEAIRQAEETREERIEEMRRRSEEEAESDSTGGDGG